MSVCQDFLRTGQRPLPAGTLGTAHLRPHLRSACTPRCRRQQQCLSGAPQRDTSVAKLTTARASILDTLTSFFSPPKQQPAKQARQRPAEVSQILELIQERNPDKAAIIALVKQLQEQQQNAQVTTDPQLLSATWRLLWTTEKETEFIVKNAAVFGTRAGDVYQTIDVLAGTLQNVITFPPEGAFVVNSSIEVEGDQRVAFKFNSAELRLPNDRIVKLPPFGQGWFDNVYVDVEVRIARDIRQDVLVVARDGPARVF